MAKNICKGTDIARKPAYYRSLRIRKGEPLNRIVVHFGSKSYELDEITPNLLEKDELYYFVIFHYTYFF